MKLLSHSQLLATPWTAAYQAPLSMDFPGKSTGVGSSLSLLQGNFPTQESNQGLLHCRQILSQLSYPRSPNLPQEEGILPVTAFRFQLQIIDYPI